MDLAQAVGCTPHQITRWSHLGSPPSRFNKGFDTALADALRTTKNVLLADFSQLAPEKAPIFDRRSTEIAKRSIYSELLNDANVRARIDEALRSLVEGNVDDAIRKVTFEYVIRHLAEREAAAGSKKNLVAKVRTRRKRKP